MKIYLSAVLLYLIIIILKYLLLKSDQNYKITSNIDFSWINVSCYIGSRHFNDAIATVIRIIKVDGAGRAADVFRTGVNTFWSRRHTFQAWKNIFIVWNTVQDRRSYFCMYEKFNLIRNLGL